MVPKETDIVVMANLQRARGATLWKRLLEARDKDAAAKKQYDDFVKKCQFDPLQQIDSVFLALPQNADDSREFALIARGPFQGERLVDCIHTLAREKGYQVTETLHGQRKLYSVPGEEGYFAIVSPRVVLLAGKGWARRVLDLADDKTSSQGARDNQALSAIIKRTRTGDALWGAGIVPPAVAERLKGQPQLGAAASIKSVAGSIDLDQGLTLNVSVDLGTNQDAAELSNRINEQLQNGRKDRNVQLLGLSSYFDSIQVASKGNALSGRISLTQEQVDDLLARLSGLMKTLEMRSPAPGLPELPSARPQAK